MATIPLTKRGAEKLKEELGGLQNVERHAVIQAIADRYGLSPPLGRATEAAALIADVMRESGYLHADIKPREPSRLRRRLPGTARRVALC